MYSFNNVKNYLKILISVEIIINNILLDHPAEEYNGHKLYIFFIMYVSKSLNIYLYRHLF